MKKTYLKNMIKKVYEKTYIIKWLRWTYIESRRKRLNKEMIENVKELQDRIAVDLLIGEKKHLSKSGRIKVRFFHELAVLWTSIESLAKAFEADGRFDVMIVVVRCFIDITSKIEQAEAAGMYYAIDGEDYIISEDRPDIVILTTPHMDQGVKDIKDFRKYAKYIFVAPHTLISYDGGVADNYLENLHNVYGSCKPDAYFFDGLMYKYLIKQGINTSNVYLQGNVKYDEIYEAARSSLLPPKWKKLENKKIVFYATTHNYDRRNGSATKMIAFDIYAKTLLEYCSCHLNIALIFRPHPVMIQELVDCGCWSQNDVIRLKTFFNNSENMVWDSGATYKDALQCCDAILTDVFCGLSCTALPMKKPIGLLYRTEDIMPPHEEVSDILYQIKSIKDLEKYLDMVESGEDEMYEMRSRGIDELVVHFDGKNGERLKNEMVKLAHVDI